MPGKVNPVLCEVVTQVAAQVVGHDAAVGFAGSQGTLEMNTYLPVIADNLLSAISLLGRAAGDFGSRCVRRDRGRSGAMPGVRAGEPCAGRRPQSVVGYDVATQLVRRAEAEHRPLRDVVLDSGLLEPSQVESAFDVDRVGTRHVVSAREAQLDVESPTRTPSIGAAQRAIDVAQTRRARKTIARMIRTRIRMPPMPYSMSNSLSYRSDVSDRCAVALPGICPAVNLERRTGASAWNESADQAITGSVSRCLHRRLAIPESQGRTLLDECLHRRRLGVEHRVPVVDELAQGGRRQRARRRPSPYPMNLQWACASRRKSRAGACRDSVAAALPDSAARRRRRTAPRARRRPDGRPRWSCRRRR